MEDLRREVEVLIEKKQFDEAVELLNNGLKDDESNLQLLELRGNVYYTQEKFGDALNDFNKVLKEDKENKAILAKAEMVKQILRFQNLDIFESTNLNLDPWLD